MGARKNWPRKEENRGHDLDGSWTPLTQRQNFSELLHMPMETQGRRTFHLALRVEGETAAVRGDGAAIGPRHRQCRQTTEQTNARALSPNQSRDVRIPHFGQVTPGWDA